MSQRPNQSALAPAAARRQLAASLDVLQRALDTSERHIAIVDDRGEILMTNRAWKLFAQANGAAPEAVEGNYLAVCERARDDELAERAAAGLRAVLSGETPAFSLEYPCHGPRVRRWFVLRAAAFDGAGPARALLSHIDVTAEHLANEQLAKQAVLLDEAHVAAERELGRTRNHLQAVTDSIGEGLFTLDRNGRVTYANGACEQLLGWPAEQLLGAVMHELTHYERGDGSPHPIEDCPIMRARCHGQVVRVNDDVFMTRDGRRLPVAYTASPLTTEDGIEGCVVVFVDMSEYKARQDALRQEAEKLEQIEQIAQALAEDRFELYAQPIIDLASGAVVQRELLLRMHTLDGTLASPASFLPIAETYGLIGDIDRWVVREGLRIAADGSPVEINLSAVSIGDPVIADHIERCLAEQRVEPTTIVFEITETALIRDEHAARAFADRLHALGAKLALDDFGTGYGSMSSLKQFPVDILKIDIEFVRDLSSNRASRHVVESIVALARSFEIQTVAEGVEDAETLALVRELGVDFAQGFHIGYPAPVTRANNSRRPGPAASAPAAQVSKKRSRQAVPVGARRRSPPPPPPPRG